MITPSDVKSQEVLAICQCGYFLCYKVLQKHLLYEQMDFYIIHGLILCLWPTLKKRPKFIRYSSIQFTVH